MAFYPGGKKRLGRELAEVITEISSAYNVKGYCEPFCGMLGVYRHIPESFRECGINRVKFLAGDQNKYVIKLLEGVQNGWKPPSQQCTKKEYDRYKENNSSSLTSIFYGFACSCRGDFRSGYFDKNNCSIQSEDMVEIGSMLQDVRFSAGSYDQFSNVKQFVLYLDPPYRDTKNNYYEKDQRNSHFDYDEFIEWVREMAKDNLIFISEYTKPCREAKLVWEHGKEKLYMM